jgi:N utilization substance protein B
MIRNVAREIAMHLCFELSFTDLPVEELLDQRLSGPHFDALSPEYEVYGELPGPTQRNYIRKLVSGISVHSYELDQYIEKYAKGWRFERIPLVASAIMRLAMYEILYMPEIPDGAAINEAVEIAKKYESPEVVRFINGILGTFVRAEAADDAPDRAFVPAAEPAKAEE